MMSQETLWRIIDYVTIGMDWGFFLIAANFLGHATVPFKRNIKFFMLSFLAMGLIDIVSIDPNTRVVGMIIVSIFVFKGVYKGSLKNSFIVALLFYLALMAYELISVIVLVVFYHLEDMTLVIGTPVFRGQAMIVSKSLMILSLIVLHKGKPSFNFKLKESFLIGIPVTATLVSLFAIYGYNFTRPADERYSLMGLMLITVLMLFSIGSLFFIINMIIRNEKQRSEVELINKLMQTSYQQYDRMEEAHQRLRHVYHDLHNHLLCLKHLPTIEEMQAYISELEGQVKEFETFRYTGNKALDIILSEKLHLCRAYGIEFDDQINISQLDFMSDVEICALFANSLDNAIEACQRMGDGEEKYIDMMCKVMNGFMVFKLVNSKVNEIKMVGNRLQTTKTDREEHGIGLSSIQYIVDKYGGEMVINHSENEFHLSILIAIPE